MAIDENEYERINLLLKSIFHNMKHTTVAIVHNPSGQQGKNFSYCHDYACFSYKGDSGKQIGDELRKKGDKRNFRDVTGIDSRREAAKNCFYPIYIKNGKIVGFGDICNSDYHPPSINVDVGDGITEVFPIDPQGVERKWRFARANVQKIADELYPHYLKSRKVWDIKRIKNKFNFKTVWSDAKYSGNNHGTQLLNNILGTQVFDYPKSVYTVVDCIGAALNKQQSIVLDYFAGSGTTGHAVIDLNRQDNGKRKYILVEMGDHFDTVLLPRIKKVVYAQNWKNGKPTSRDEGVSSIIKYIRLESYEDTLDGLILTPPKDDLLAMNNPALVEDYRLRYALEVETAGSPCLLGEAFDDPFTYTLRIVQDGTHHERSVDLPETFNYLLGLRVDSRKYLEGVLAIAGKEIQGQSCLILWRNLKAMDDCALEYWFRQHRDQLPDSLDMVFVNGDHTLNALRQQHESWTAKSIEPIFRELMFKVEDL